MISLLSLLSALSVVVLFTSLIIPWRLTITSAILSILVAIIAYSYQIISLYIVAGMFLATPFIRIGSACMKKEFEKSRKYLLVFATQLVLASSLIGLVSLISSGILLMQIATERWHLVFVFPVLALTMDPIALLCAMISVAHAGRWLV